MFMTSPMYVSSFWVCAPHAPSCSEMEHLLVPKSPDSGVRTAPSSDRAVGVAQPAERNVDTKVAMHISFPFVDVPV